MTTALRAGYSLAMPTEYAGGATIETEFVGERMMTLLSRQGTKYVTSTTFWLIGAMLGIWCAAPYAADTNLGFSDKAYTILIDHMAGKFGTINIQGPGLDSSTPRDLSTQDMPVSFTLPTKSSVTIKIAHPNGALFTYTIGERSTVDTDNAKALSTFAEALKKTLSVPGTQTDKGKASSRDRNASPYLSGQVPGQFNFQSCSPTLKIEGIDVAVFEHHLKVLGDAWGTTLPKAIEKSANGTRDDAMRELRDTEESINALKNDLDKFLGLSSKVLLKSSVSYSYQACKEDKLEVQNGDSVFANIACAGNTCIVNSSSENELSQHVNNLGAQLAQKDELKKLVQLADDAVKKIRSLGEDVSLAIEKVESAKVVTRKVLIAENAKFDPLVNDAAKKLRSDRIGKGEYSIQIRPKDSFSLSIAPGVFYSFVRNPEYSVSKKAETLVVAQKQNDYNALSGVVALNIALSKFNGESFQPLVQVGVAPDSDKLAVVLGVGFKALDNLSFSLGAVYQKTNQLKNGLSVGQELATPDDLQTEQKFKSGFYIGVNYTVN